MRVRFQAEDPETDSVRFLADTEVRQTQCLITYSALEDHFHATDGRYREAFAAHTDAILEATARKLGDQQIEFGMVILRNEDF